MAGLPVSTAEAGHGPGMVNAEASGCAVTGHAGPASSGVLNAVEGLAQRTGVVPQNGTLKAG